MGKLENKTFAELKIGDIAYVEKKLTDEDIKLFAKVSGDVNPVHLDEEYAKTTMFKGRIAHGLWSAGLLSAVLGTKLPGPGAIYLNQTLSFRRPVKIGDTIRAEVIVTKLDPEKKRVTLECKCTNQNNEKVTLGEAELITPPEKIITEASPLPEISFIDSTSKHKVILQQALQDKREFNVAVVYPVTAASISSIIEATKLGLINPIFIGPAKKMQQVAAELNQNLNNWEYIDAKDEGSAAKRAVELVHEGKAQAIMKADIKTAELLHPVVSSKTGIRNHRRISHCSVIDIPTYDKLMFFSDCAVNTYPDINIKQAIIQNAIDFAKIFNVKNPKTAILSAVENPTETMPDTLEAQQLTNMAKEGKITGGIVHGPLAFDDAISQEAAESKHIKCSVCGDVDIFIVPNIEMGNNMLKALRYLANSTYVGIVIGANVPIILLSRYTTTNERIFSCAYAKIYAAKMHK